MRKVNIKAKWKKEWKKEKEKEKRQQKQISKKQHYPSSRWTGVSIFPVRALSSLTRRKKKVTHRFQHKGIYKRINT